MSAEPRSSGIRFTYLPKTRPGILSGIGAGGFFLSIALLFLLDAIVPDAGAEGFFANPHLAIPLILACLSSTFGLGCSVHAFLRKSEASLVSVLAFALGVFVLMFAIGEIFFEH